MKILELVCVLVGLANLAFYGWGSHDPSNLAVGIACLFLVLWGGPGRHS